ncbi:MAG: replication initiation protein [Anaerobutyricum hallii]|uniref:replication initiation protein n=1 Tax=Anaerobutyricum hallii TaxID=39488 RepID=UPI002E76E143|nr:replication initiation protein [Anaerobutyricum hallii]MEE1485969.1 replication initiation protein [Anaerobutyricum hallii]
MKKTKIVELPETNEILSRSNKLILSRYSATLVENKIMALSFKRVKLNKNGNPAVVFTTNELRKLTGVRGNGFYDQLKIAAAGLMNKMVYMEDEQAQSFSFINLIQKAEYREGAFTVVFTNESKALLYDLKSNFTSMSIDTLFSFKTNHAYRLYEILKVHEYKIGNNNKPVEIVYPLSDLKLQLNCINTEGKKVKIELMKPHPNYDKIVNDLDTEKKFESWYEFKRRVLEKAIKEINQTTELNISYAPIRTGRGGKTTAVRFYLQRKIVEKNNTVESKETTRSEMVGKVKEIIKDVNLSRKDCISLLKASDNNLDKIETAYELAKKQEDIVNFVAWMISAIKNEYEKPVEVVEGSQEKAERVKKIKENMDERKEVLAEEIWNKFKEKENFDDFVKKVEEETGLSFYFFDSMIPAYEKNQRYVQWMESK